MFGFGKIEEVDWDAIPWDDTYLYRDNAKDWTDCTEDKLKYVIEESRLYLQSILDNNNRLLNKAFFLLTVFVGLIGYIFAKFVSSPNNAIASKWFIWFLGIYLVFLIFVYLFIVIKYVMPSMDYFYVGTKPANLLYDKVMALSSQKIIVELLRDYHLIIKHNEERNELMAHNIIKCAMLIPAPLIIASIISFLSYLLS
ncbi:MAG: hypothetical protein ABSB91_01045 [Sedimentisphaerales bacterium]|jgi:hypothetical protein